MEDRGPQIMAIAILFLSLTWTTVLLRLYVRKFIIKALGLDDLWMVISLIFFTAYAACQLGGIAHGTGQHRDAIKDSDAQTALAFWFFCEIFYTISTSILKVSIGYFLLRIAVQVTHVWIIRFVMVSSCVCGFVYCCIVLFQCRPISYWWDLDPEDSGSCLGAYVMADTTYVVSALNSIGDWVFGILPVFIVKDLQMKSHIKIVVVSVLGLAAIGSTATIVRMPYLWTLKEYKGDFLYRTSDVAIWTTVEVGVGITAGCIATLRPLLTHFLALTGLYQSSHHDSKAPFTKSKRAPTKHGYMRSFEGSQILDDLRPVGDKSMTTTTVIGRRHESGRLSDEEMLPVVPEGSTFEIHGWGGGISKSVQVTTVAERDSSKSESSHTLEEERSLPNQPPTSTYERF